MPCTAALIFRHHGENNNPTQIKKELKTYKTDDVSTVVMETQRASPRSAHQQMQQLAKGLSLCIAYAANTGGIATLTGTPPNLVLKGQVDM